MARPPRLSDDQISTALGDLPGWELRDGTLHREFEFDDFSRAFGFMAACATVAQALDHHPDWSNVYATVVVTLSTHDVGGLTELDVQLATKMSQFAD
jgi:4a-hydroxytetrahydrobiopterin dehydratase